MTNRTNKRFATRFHPETIWNYLKSVPRRRALAKLDDLDDRLLDDIGLTRAHLRNPAFFDS